MVPHIVARATYLPDTIRCAGTPFRPRPYDEPEKYGFLVGKPELQCFADIRVNAYVLGSGPPTMTVKVTHDFYSRNATEEQVQELTKLWMDFLLVDEVDIRFHEDISIQAIPGREAMMFLGPMVDTSVEGWNVFETWRVERREDGTTVAAHPYRSYFDGRAQGPTGDSTAGIRKTGHRSPGGAHHRQRRTGAPGNPGKTPRCS